jgi:diadenosine tetraphosphate (Ap4A) HIT family hydrolase
MSDCIFCAIIAGQEPASIVYEDDDILAFLDIFPINAGHTLVVPKRHAARLADLDDATAAKMIVAANRVAQALYRSGLFCQGINLTLADGAAAGQEVPHVHLHVVPRFRGDGFHCMRAGGIRAASRQELEETAARLREAM